MHKIKTKVLEALDDIKAKDIVTLDIAAISPITEYMIIATGTSTRHIQAIAEKVVVMARTESGFDVGIQGKNSTDWILIDLGSVVVHLMLPDTRDFYALEKLWQLPASDSSAVA